MKYLPRIEVVLALAALALALIAGLYLIFETMVQHENCYGINANKIQCQSITGANVSETLGRLALILSIVLALYAAGALCALAQGRAVQPDSRLTAYMGLVTCALTTLGITLPAVDGVGFFFVPATIVFLMAPFAGLPPLIETYRARARKR